MPSLPGQDVFVVGPAQWGSRLLYRLLCLHPEVAYVSTLEARFPWLPVAVTGRLRPRRYASKLRHWFEGHPDAPAAPGIGTLMGRMICVPADAEVVCGRGAGRQALDPHAVARLRSRLVRLRDVACASVLAFRVDAASRRLPVVDALFPQARYLSVVEGRRGKAGSADVSRALARIPGSRVLYVELEDLVADPIDQLRRVLEFLRLERRRDYEWALKALKLPEAAALTGREESNGSAIDTALTPGERRQYPVHSEYAS